jgi:GPH family glycoside/pentoside/hexuronide:cation symporter
VHGDKPVVWLYVLIVNMIYTTGYSIYNVPLLAMAPEMTEGFDERSVLQGWRVMFSSLGTAVTSIGTGAILGILGHRTGPGGRVVNSASDYAILAGLFAVLTFAGMITGWAGTRRARFTEQVRSSASWGAQTASFFANRAALIIIGVKSVQLIGIASTSAATFFMLIYVLKLSPAVLPALGLPVLIVSFIVTPLLARLSKVIGKRGGYLIGALSTGVAALSWVLARPGEPIYFLMLRGAVTGVAFSANVMFAMSMLNDAMEMDALRTGLRREGLYSALYSFVEKFGYAVGPAAVGAALSLAGFDATRSVTAANAASVRQAALLGVAYIPAGCAVIAVILLAFYRLDRKALDAARAASLTGAAALA